MWRKFWTRLHSHFMKSECEVRPQFMKSGRGGCGGFFTTEYTEVGESILKITERSSVYSVWERSDLSVYSVVKWGLGISRVEHKDSSG